MTIYLSQTILCACRLAGEDVVTYNDSIVGGVAGVIKGECRVAQENTLVVVTPVEGDNIDIKGAGIPLTKLFLHIVL